MNNLVPESRVDKTGKTVIRHVRADDPGDQPKKKAVPSVKEAQNQATKKLRDKAIVRLHACYFIKNFPLGETSKNLYELAKESPETLEALVSHLENASEEEHEIWEAPLVNARNYRVDWRDPVKSYVPFYRARMATYPRVTKIVWANTKYTPNYLADRTLFDAQEMLGEYDGDSDNHLLLQAATIVTGIHGSVNRDWEPHGKAQAEYIAAHLDEADSVLDELISRGSTDIGLITELISNASPSLQDGVL